MPVSGRGEVFSFNVMHQVYHPGFAAEVPYAVVVVKLEEGAKMVSNLVGVAPHEIRIGMPVQGGVRGHHRRGDPAEVRAGVGRGARQGATAVAVAVGAGGDGVAVGVGVVEAVTASPRTAIRYGGELADGKTKNGRPKHPTEVSKLTESRSAACPGCTARSW